MNVTEQVKSYTENIENSQPIYLMDIIKMEKDSLSSLLVEVNKKQNLYSTL